MQGTWASLRTESLAVSAGWRAAGPVADRTAPDAGYGVQVVVELVGELGVEGGGGGDADQHRDEDHQRDGGEDQPRGERGEEVAHPGLRWPA